MIKHTFRNQRAYWVLAIGMLVAVYPTSVSATNCGEAPCSNYSNPGPWQFKCCVQGGLGGSGCREFKRREVTCSGGSKDYDYALIQIKVGWDCDEDPDTWTGQCVPPEPPPP